jgi:FixJ family two-component response regulator
MQTGPGHAGDLHQPTGADRARRDRLIFGFAIGIGPSALLGHGDVPTTVRAMKAGAVEFLTKPFGDDALLNAIEQAIERSQTALAHGAEVRALRDRHASLTPREGEIMALVVSGLLNKQIAVELGISEITVKAHRGQVMRKMQVDSLADLVRVAATLNVPLVAHV